VISDRSRLAGPAVVQIDIVSPVQSERQGLLCSMIHGPDVFEHRQDLELGVPGSLALT
jgi:hypothetical protein